MKVIKNKKSPPGEERVIVTRALRIHHPDSCRPCERLEICLRFLKALVDDLPGKATPEEFYEFTLTSAKYGHPIVRERIKELWQIAKERALV